MLSDRGWGPVRMAAGVGFQAGKMVARQPRRQHVDVAHRPARAGLRSAGDRRQHGTQRHHRLRGQRGMCSRRHSWLHGHRRAGSRGVVGAADDADPSPTRRRGTRRCRSSPPNVPTSPCGIGRPSAPPQGIPLAADNTHLPGARAISAAQHPDRRRRHDPTGWVEAHRARGHSSARWARRTSINRSRRSVSSTPATPGSGIAAGGTLTVDLSAYTPADAVAAVVNVTAASPSVAGYLTVWPCDARPPVASSVNFLAGREPRRAGHDAAAPTRSSRCASSATRRPTSSSTCKACSCRPAPCCSHRSRRTASSTPATPAGPRRSRSRRPPGAEAVAATLTVTGGSAAGFLTAYPCAGTPPVVSNVNWQAGETVAGAVFVPVAADGTFCIFTSSPTDVIVDITGVFSDCRARCSSLRSRRRAWSTPELGIGGWRGHPGRRPDHRDRRRTRRRGRGHRHDHDRLPRYRRVPDGHDMRPAGRRDVVGQRRGWRR